MATRFVNLKTLDGDDLVINGQSIVKSDGVTPWAEEGAQVNNVEDVEFNGNSIIDANDKKAKLHLTLVKEATPETGYFSTYKLMVGPDGSQTQVGDSINIPKDYLVRSATLETCSSDDDPVAGYLVGDKYIDFVVNTYDTDPDQISTDATHIYILLRDLIPAGTTVTAGDGITITGGVISALVGDGLDLVSSNPDDPDIPKSIVIKIDPSEQYLQVDANGLKLDPTLEAALANMVIFEEIVQVP